MAGGGLKGINRLRNLVPTPTGPRSRRYVDHPGATLVPGSVNVNLALGATPSCYGTLDSSTWYLYSARNAHYLINVNVSPTGVARGSVSSTSADRGPCESAHPKTRRNALAKGCFRAQPADAEGGNRGGSSRAEGGSTRSARSLHVQAVHLRAPADRALKPMTTEVCWPWPKFAG